jgi:hypothetical protein
MDTIAFSLRVTAPSPNVARVSVGGRQFSVGRPLEFDDASPHVAAIEYALGAIGGEVVNGLRAFADRRRLSIDAVEAVVSATLENGLTYLEVIGAQGQPKIARIHIKIFVAALDLAATHTLFEQMLDRLPLVCTLRGALVLTTELVVTS